MSKGTVVGTRVVIVKVVRSGWIGIHIVDREGSFCRKIGSGV